MKGFGLWVFLFMVGTALMCIFVSSKTTSFSVLDTAVIHHKEDSRLPMKNRKLKENDYTRRHNKKTVGSSLDLEDYGPTDPVPNSKASIHPGPIQHGTPVVPYIPKPTPPAPDHP